MSDLQSHQLSDDEIRARQWGMFIHLSILAGYLMPLAGFIVPVVMWQMKKYEHPLIDAHGKNVTNWLLSVLIYAIAGWLLILTLIGALIGIPLLWALGILNLIFALVGALKANNGEVWSYPFTIRFFN